MVGKTILHYRVIEKLGSGGMGIVYKAEDTRLGRYVALKFLPDDMAKDREALDRFQREARAASAMDHPNICTIHDIGEYEGQPFIVMQLLEGQTLQHLVDRPLSIDRILELGVQIAEALDAAHSRGIIHRDIKPANLFVTSRQQVKILDFGLAKLSADRPNIGRAPEASELPTMAGDVTVPGVTLGTVAYMSPEQARGENLDARTDLFSLGAVLYEMATGKQAFGGGSTAVVFSSILEKSPVPLHQVNPDLAHQLAPIIDKALEKDPSMRYQSAADLRSDLSRLKRDRDSAQSRPSPSAQRPSKSGRKIAAIAGLVALLVAATMLYRFLAVPAPIDSVAVLPFTNMTSEGDAEYLSDGITDNLINNLSQLRGLRVVPRSTVFRYKGKVVDPQEVGRELNVRAVLAGRVIQRGDTLEIGVELVDVAGQAQLWGQQYSRKLTDILAIQTDLAREISSRLHLELSGEEQSRLVRNYTENTEAYHLYLKGLYHRQKTTEEGFNESIKYFQQAVELDPTYPLAYAGLADSYASLGYLNVLPPREVWPKAKVAATTALKLDDTLAEAHAALGAPLLFYDWDWARARQEFDRAVELNPKYAITHHWYAHYWSMIGNVEEALKESRLAVQSEPLDLMLNAHLLFYLTGPNNAEEFAERARKLRELEPDFWAIHTTNGMSLAGRTMYEDAIVELEKGAESSGRMPLALHSLLGGYAMAGKRAGVERIEGELQKKKYLSAGFLATIYGRLPDSYREKTRILNLLEKAYQERDSQLLNLRRWPEPWKSDPEFENLIQRVGLPE